MAGSYGHPGEGWVGSLERRLNTHKLNSPARSPSPCEGGMKEPEFFG